MLVTATARGEVRTEKSRILTSTAVAQVYVTPGGFTIGRSLRTGRRTRLGNEGTVKRLRLAGSYAAFVRQGLTRPPRDRGDSAPPRGNAMTTIGDVADGRFRQAVTAANGEA